MFSAKHYLKDGRVIEIVYIYDESVDGCYRAEDEVLEKLYEAERIKGNVLRWDVYKEDGTLFTADDAFEILESAENIKVEPDEDWGLGLPKNL